MATDTWQRSGVRSGRDGASVLDWPTGLTRWVPQLCEPGYTLLTPFGSPIVYLLDIAGHVVHMWFVSLGPEVGQMTNLAKYVGDGHMLFKPRFTRTEAWGEEPSAEAGAAWLCEMDWNGNIVWIYRPSGPPDDPHLTQHTVGWDDRYRQLIPHHDFQRLPNGNTILLGLETVSNPNISDRALRSDYFLEIQSDGTPVWIWHADQHFDEFNFSLEARRLIREVPGVHMGHPLGDYLHINTLEVLPETPLGQRDSRFRSGNILSCQRNTNTIFVVDRESGAVVWHWGREELVGPHHPSMLANGHILVYDNGGQAGYPRRTRLYTRLLEMDPESGKIVWTYVHDARGTNHHRFFSPSWGSVQRLASGNTFSLDANLGRLFEVTPQGEVVWEYVNGFRGMCPYGHRGETAMLTGVYRAMRLPLDALPAGFEGSATQVSGEATLLRHPHIR